MLVNELKNEIKKYDKKELEFIIVSLYKRIPKKVKEEYDIDSYIKNIDINKKTDVVKKEIPFDEIYNEIIYFIECIDLGYYCSLNRVISKKDRSTWRFKVKRFYKELNKISPDSENGSIATSLLIELFKRLSRGTSILLFTNWNTFGASGIEQRDYYDVLIKRITFNGLTKESLKECVDLISVDNDPNGYSLFSAFINNLKTIDSINISIDLLKEKIISLKEELSNTKNGTDSYYINKNIKGCILCIADLYFINKDIDKGIKYFKDNYYERFDEVKEYILLCELEDYGLYDEWIKEYESNIGKIDYRDTLIEKYNELKGIVIS